jgi:hypothetical protein
MSCVYDRTLFTKIPGLDNYYVSESARCIRFYKSVNELSKSIENGIPHWWFLICPETLKFQQIPVEEILARTFVNQYYSGCAVHFIDGNNFNFRLDNMQCI